MCLCEQRNVGVEKFWVSPDLSYVLLAHSVHKVGMIYSFIVCY